MTLPLRSLPLVVAVLVVAIVALHVRLIAGGQTWADTRYHTEVAPPRLAAADAVQAGELPAWWEGSGLGVPLAAEPSHGALYPLTWLEATARGLDLLAIAHLIWAALGIAVWARRRAPRPESGVGQASEPAALVAGLLAATSGLFASAAVRGALPALAHLPWIAVAAGMLAGAEDRRGRARAAALLGALIGLVGTAGVAALLIDGIAIAAAIGARARAWRWFAAAVAGGLAIGAVQWLPAIASLGASAGGEVRELHLGRLVELIAPGAFGSGDPERGIAALAGAAPWAPSLFVGAPLLALSAVRTPPRRLLGVMIALAALALIVGRGGWPAWLGAPELHLAALVVVLAANAAAGIDALVAAERRALIALGVGAACTAAALCALAALRARVPDAAGAIDRALLEGGLGLLSIAFALGLAWRRPQRRGSAVLFVLLLLPSAGAAPATAPITDRAIVDEPPVWARAAQEVPPPRRVFRPVFMHELPATTEDAIATLAGASAWRWGIGAARSEDLARPAVHDALWLAAARDGGALLDRFGISLAILPESLLVPRHLRPLGVRGAWALVAFPAAPPASVVRGALWAAATDDVLALLFPPDRALPRGTIVLRGAAPPGPQASSPEPQPCEIRAWRAGAIELACTADAPSYAVVSSTSAAGWTATVDDAPAAWWTADAIRRAVPIAAGPHVVRWTYETPLGTAGLVAAGGGALLLLGVFALSGRRKRRA